MTSQHDLDNKKLQELIDTVPDRLLRHGQDDPAEPSAYKNTQILILPLSL